MADPAEAQDRPATELQLAEQVAAGTLPSGYPCGGARLWAVRISGTGLAARPAHKEIALRDAGTWLSDEMVQRCAGLPVVIEHPEGGQLDGAEFAGRVVGMVTLAYPRDGELWGIGKIFDVDANAALEAGACSTSPSVTFGPGDGGQVLELDDGKRLHLEGNPFRIDHLALVPDAAGVWDRGQTGRGVRSNSNQPGDRKLSDTMTDNAPQPDAVMSALDKLATCMADMASKLESTGSRLDGLCSRMDSMEKAGQRDPGAPPGSPALTVADSLPKTLAEERAENQARAEAQVRADAAAVSFGERAPPPMQGETPIAYRKRLLRPYRKYSPDYKEIDVDAVSDAAILGVIEHRIYADAIAAAGRAEHLPDDELHPITRTDESGRRITTYRGSRSFIHDLKPPTMRVVKFRHHENGMWPT